MVRDQSTAQAQEQSILAVDQGPSTELDLVSVRKTDLAVVDCRMDFWFEFHWDPLVGLADQALGPCRSPRCFGIEELKI